MVRKTAKYKVTLTDEERTELEVLISAGKSAAPGSWGRVRDKIGGATFHVAESPI